MEDKDKDIDFEKIKNVAEYLMKINGFATTLDVEEELKNKGFIASQELLSEYMNEIYEDNKYSLSKHPNDIVWDFLLDTHRKYFLTLNCEARDKEHEKKNNIDKLCLELKFIDGNTFTVSTSDVKKLIILLQNLAQ